MDGEFNPEEATRPEVEATQSPASLPKKTPQSTSSPGSSDIEESFRSDLFDLYDKIFKWLRFAGLKRTNRDPYPIWELAVKGRTLAIVNDPGLHLVWKGAIQYIKPLPEWFADDSIIEKLSENGGVGLECTRGFFHSYTDIIKSKLDYDMALGLGLLPEPWRSAPSVNGADGWNGWESWETLTEAWRAANKQDENGEGSTARPRRPRLPRNCHRRYEYCELRLARLNWIMWFRYLPHYFQMKDYKPHFYTTQDAFGMFWHGYGKWIAILFAYSTILMTAMLVTLAAGDMPQWFKNGCLGISYTLISLVIFHGASFAIYISLWSFNRTWLWIRIQIRNRTRNVQE